MLIVAGTFLFQFTDYVVKGVSPFTVLTLMGLVLPGVLAKTFPMAMLLGTLLSFGRLSGDSEITALRAAGTSLNRILLPVGIFGLVVSVSAFLLNELVVPRASFKATQMRDDIKTKIDGNSFQATSYPIVKDSKLQAMVVAQNFSITTGTMMGVVVLVYNTDGEWTSSLQADKLEYRPAAKILGQTEDDWKIVGKAKLISVDGKYSVDFERGAWPQQVPKPNFKPEDVFAERLKDLDSQSMADMQERIQKAKETKKATKGQIANLEFGYWNKIAVPLSAFVFALVGAPLGIRNHRSGTSAGFWLAVIIIFGYQLVSTMMNIFNQGGAIQPWAAAFAPTMIGLIVAAITIHSKNK